MYDILGLEMQLLNWEGNFKHSVKIAFRLSNKEKPHKNKNNQRLNTEDILYKCGRCIWVSYV